MWAQGKLKANTCAGAPANKTGELIGTTFVARDFISVVDALKEDGMLRYWGEYPAVGEMLPDDSVLMLGIGISYGSLLGATIAYIFPDRIDKLLLDGVVNPHEYYLGP